MRCGSGNSIHEGGFGLIAWPELGWRGGGWEGWGRHNYEPATQISDGAEQGALGVVGLTEVYHYYPVAAIPKSLYTKMDYPKEEILESDE